MKKKTVQWKEILIFLSIIFAANLISYLLSFYCDDNNPFAMPLFILAVALIARFTSGYIPGIVASVVSVICVNWLFTYPFGKFNVSLQGYPLDFLTMLVVSLLISTLTTRIKNQEHLKAEMEKEMVRSNLMRSMSHDIRTPLSVISGATDTLMEGDALSEKQRTELLSSIKWNSEWLIRLTENLLSITRVSGENPEIQKQSEALEEIIESASVKFRNQYPEITVRADYPEQVVFVDVDATLIQQVLLNLLENSAIHGKNVKTIRINTACEDTRVVVYVEDDGIGFIKKESRENENSLPAAADSHRSMGIGLSVCGTIIKAHGGEMKTYNAESGGAVVSFSLPWKGDADA